jgi:nucleotidyltransferase substrate binding protein (TIGR01987 family)
MGSRRMDNGRKHGPRGRIDTGFLRRCIRALEVAFQAVESYGESDVLFDLYRAACVKEFELVLEQSGMLLRKRLAAFFASNRQADELAFKDLFRYAAKHRLIDVEMAERWLGYRDRRNDTTHRYGEHFAEAILDLLPAFIADAKALADTIEAANDG